jgi:hypothetical protein
MAKVTPPIEALPTESRSDFIKFRVFLSLGVNRSLDKAYKTYYETNHEVTPLWQDMAEQNHWEDRALAYDKASQPAHK